MCALPTRQVHQTCACFNIYTSKGFWRRRALFVAPTGRGHDASCARGRRAGAQHAQPGGAHAAEHGIGEVEANPPRHINRIAAEDLATCLQSFGQQVSLEGAREMLREARGLPVSGRPHFENVWGAMRVLLLSLC